jgi:hypothetical protein
VLQSLVARQHVVVKVLGHYSTFNVFTDFEAPSLGIVLLPCLGVSTILWINNHEFHPPLKDMLLIGRFSFSQGWRRLFDLLHVTDQVRSRLHASGVRLDTIILFRYFPCLAHRMPSIRLSLQVSGSPFSGSFGDATVGFGQEAVGFFLRIAERWVHATADLGGSVRGGMLQNGIFPSDGRLLGLVGNSLEHLLTTATLLTEAALKGCGLASLETVNGYRLLKFQPFSVLEILCITGIDQKASQVKFQVIVSHDISSSSLVQSHLVSLRLRLSLSLLILLLLIDNLSRESSHCQRRRGYHESFGNMMLRKTDLTQSLREECKGHHRSCCN